MPGPHFQLQTSFWDPTFGQLPGFNLCFVGGGVLALRSNVPLGSPWSWCKSTRKMYRVPSNQHPT